MISNEIKHEINNDLMIIRGYVDFVKKQITDEKLKCHLEIVIKRCDKLIENVENYVESLKNELQNEKHSGNQ